MTPHSRGNKMKVNAWRSAVFPEKECLTINIDFMRLLFYQNHQNCREIKVIFIQSTKKLFFLNLKPVETSRVAFWSSPTELSPLASPNLTKNDGSGDQNGQPRVQKCFELINLWIDSVRRRFHRRSRKIVCLEMKTFLSKMELLSVSVVWWMVFCGCCCCFSCEKFNFNLFLFIICGVYQIAMLAGRGGEEEEFKVTYTGSSSSFSLARRLSWPFRTPRGRPPSTWRNIPNTRTRWFSQTSPCLPKASPAPASSSPALWLCADHFWDLFCYRLRWLVHWGRNVSPKTKNDLKNVRKACVNKSRRWAHLWCPLFRNIFQRVWRIYREAHEDNVGVGIAQWPQSVVVFLSGCIP